jgi:hypothetical protein
LKYTVSNLPTCLGYDGSITFIAVMVLSDGTESTFGEVLSDYNACLASLSVDES